MSASGGGRAIAAAVFLLLAIAATVALGTAFPQTLTSTALSGPEIGDVDERTSVCPLLRRGEDSTETVSVFSWPDQGDALGGGEVRETGVAPQPLPAPGAAISLEPAADAATVSVVSSGSRSASTATVRNSLDTGDEGRGLALGQCLPARAQWWFVGVSAGPGQIDELLLANPTDSPAVVALEMFGPAGPIALVGARGVVVQPGQESVIRVDSLIPGISEATLRVSTTGGLVAAAVRATAIDGLIPQGAEFIPPASPPARSLVVPAVLPGDGPRRLLLTAGPRDAAARVLILTPDGPAPQSSAEQIPVPAGTTVSIDLAPRAAGMAASVIVEASAPLTGAVQSVIKGIPAPEATGVLNRVPVADVAWTAAAEPLMERLLLPLSGVAEASGGLLVSAVGGAATVSVEARAASGATYTEAFELTADAVREVAVPITPGEATSVSVTARGTGRVYAAAYQAGALPDGPLATAALGTDPSTTVTLPLAYPDPQVLQPATRGQ